MKSNLRLLLSSVLIVSMAVAGASAAEPTFHLASFQADVTIPLGHRCMGILPTKSKEIVDPLEARGFVLLGGEKPVVLVAVDWCEIRNGAYDQWRDALASAAGTSRERVLVSSLHQHDAPVTDREAQQLLDGVGMKNELYEPAFQAECLKRLTAALKDSLAEARPVTHIGLGQVKVVGIASSRRVVLDDGRVAWSRYSASGKDKFLANAPDGPIDPFLKTICFYDGETPLLMLHAYATHPMSYYGRGGVSADFVGLARRQMQRAHPHAFQIYVTGCSGDVTAGKYNDGTPAARQLLTQRLYEAMEASWKNVKRHPLASLTFRDATFDLPFHEGEEFQRDHLEQTLKDANPKEGDRILAAMSLSSLDRKARGKPIDMPCLDFGVAQIVLFPGEAFVGYQLIAQQMRPDSFVMGIGYGECWPGYIPTRAAFEDNFNHGWRWVGRGSEAIIRKALEKVLAVQEK